MKRKMLNKRTFNMLETGDADVCFCALISVFVLSPLSVSDVRNYLNVWAGFIRFLPPNINIISL
jgi:hypothetical protein